MSCVVAECLRCDNLVMMLLDWDMYGVLNQNRFYFGAYFFSVGNRNAIKVRFELRTTNWISVVLWIRGPVWDSSRFSGSVLDTQIVPMRSVRPLQMLWLLCPSCPSAGAGHDGHCIVHVMSCHVHRIVPKETAPGLTFGWMLSRGSRSSWVPCIAFWGHFFWVFPYSFKVVTLACLIISLVMLLILSVAFGNDINLPQWVVLGRPQRPDFIT